MLPHYPARANCATLGGCSEPQGTGTTSTKYGKAEDMVLNMEVVLPTGEVILGRAHGATGIVDVPALAGGSGRNRERAREEVVQRRPAAVVALEEAAPVASRAKRVLEIELLEEDVINDPAIYPSAAAMDRLYTTMPYPPRVQRVVTRLWTGVKSAQ